MTVRRFAESKRLLRSSIVMLLLVSAISLGVIFLFARVMPWYLL